MQPQPFDPTTDQVEEQPPHPQQAQLVNIATTREENGDFFEEHHGVGDYLQGAFAGERFEGVGDDLQGEFGRGNLAEGDEEEKIRLLKNHLSQKIKLIGRDEFNNFIYILTAIWHHLHQLIRVPFPEGAAIS
jgi:hypothetical protein